MDLSISLTSNELAANALLAGSAMEMAAASGCRNLRVMSFSPRKTLCCKKLPDDDALILRPRHRLRRRAGERAREFRQVADGTIDAILRRRVLVRLDLQPQRLGPLLRAPALREREKEALRRREAVALFRRLIARSELECVPCDLEAAEIGDVFAEREFAVDMQIVDRHVGVELLHQFLCARVELLAVGAGPPVAQVAFGIEAAALIVEAVQHFVADDGADAAVIQRIVGLRVEIRWLHLCRRKYDLVLQRVVVRVDGLRQHAPLVAIDRLVDLGELAARLKADGG